MVTPNDNENPIACRSLHLHVGLLVGVCRARAHIDIVPPFSTLPVIVLCLHPGPQRRLLRLGFGSNRVQDSRFVLPLTIAFVVYSKDDPTSQSCASVDYLFLRRETILENKSISTQDSYMVMLAIP